MKTEIIVITILLVLSISRCNTTEPTPPQDEKPTLTLTLEDVSSIEAWIKLTTNNLQFPATVTLKQNNTVTQDIVLSNADTVIYIDSLLPNQQYKFQTIIQSSNHSYESNELSVTTMDTTSHNFTWQTWTFGEHSHSRLNDVAIIDENNIWAVGEIYMNDSLGQPDPQPYAVAHWDGADWELMKVSYHDYGTTEKFPGKLKTILSFGIDNIYVCSSANLLKLENGNWNEKAFFMISVPFNGQVNNMWGINENNLYCIGNSGAIYHFIGEQNWQEIESGTDVDLFDVWGSPAGTIWSCGYSDDYSLSVLLRYSGTEWEKVYGGSSSSQNNGYYIGPISGVWGASNLRIYMLNWGGIYTQANSNVLFLEKEIAKFSDVGFGIDGTRHNNIVACGEGFVGHWNGISYVEYPELYKDFRTFQNVSIKGDTVCAVGSDYNGFIFSEAVIAIGKQN